MHLVYIFVAFLLCFLGALSNVGGFVFLKIYFQESSMYTTLQLDTLINFCMLLISIYDLLVFRNSKKKELISRPNLIIAMCASVAVGSILGTLLYFYIYNTHGETGLVSIQNFIIFALALNSLLYIAFNSFVQTFDVRTYLPCIIAGVILGVLSSLSNVGLLFFTVLLSLIMFNVSYEGTYNISTLVVFSSLVPKIIISHLILPIQLSSIPYFTEILVLSLLGNYLGKYFTSQFRTSTQGFLYCSFLILLLILSIIKFL